MVKRMSNVRIVISPSPSAFYAPAPHPGLSNQLFAHESWRFPELWRAVAARVEACERALAVLRPVLRVLAVSPLSFPLRLYFFRRLMIRLNLNVFAKRKTDKSKRHKDGSGHHHPMGVFPIEQQVQHSAIDPSLVISPF
jgi:hypothetical protein